MQKKIVAIGGGKNGRIKSDGEREPYETMPMDQEIIKLTGKENPHFLFMAHAQSLEKQEGYFQCMVDIYNKRFECSCKHLKSSDLTDKEKIKELIEWADIIYEGGGNTLDMIKLWKNTGFDKTLENAWKNGKVMCGVSAGANCWFSECSSDSLKILYGDDQPLIGMECLGFIDGFFVPHCDAPGRYESVKEILKNKDTVGISMSNCAALEIIDDKYRIITSDASNHGIEAYGLKTYWKNNVYVEEKLDTSLQFKNLRDLISIN